MIKATQAAVIAAASLLLSTSSAWGPGGASTERIVNPHDVHPVVALQNKLLQLPRFVRR